MSVIHAPRKPEIDFRLLLFPLGMLVLLGVLFLRLWYFQVVRAPILADAATSSRELKVEKLAPRGLIYDRNGVLIAGIRPQIVVTAIPKEVQKHPEVIERVAQLVGGDPKKMWAKIKDARGAPYVGTPIFVGANLHAGAKIAEAGDQLPGIGVESQPMRYYPDSVSFTHLLGWVWIPSQRDVDRLNELNLRVSPYVGKSGIERTYEADLMGAPGAERLEVDVRRRPKRVLGREGATPGGQLQLTIDANLQKYATQLMAEKNHKGAIVALDPRNGEVLCLVSSPTYDQRLFDGGISNDEWVALNENEAKPMVNRALVWSASPGSTFKIVTAIAAYQQGRFDPNWTAYCQGGFKLGRGFTKCLGHHGSISFDRAMTKSCNTYFITLGYSMGEEALQKASMSVGLGAQTGIDLGGEGKGLVPTIEWLRGRDPDARWYGGYTVNMSIGQGQLSATPLQMANVAALAANRGVNYVPHLVRGVQKADATGLSRTVEPKVAHRVDADPAFWDSLTTALTHVIQEGSAQSAQIPGETWAGKTGSAEHIKGRKTHSWFVGFAPAQNPKIAICVLIDEAGHGGEVAAPIARNIVQRYLAPPKAVAKAPIASSNAASAPSAPVTLTVSPKTR